MRSSSPFSHEDLRALFTHLDLVSTQQYECDHTFRETRKTLEASSIALEPALKWLSEQGAGCDCEVMFNVAEKWGEIIDYRAPDSEADL